MEGEQAGKLEKIERQVLDEQRRRTAVHGTRIQFRHARGTAE